MNVFNTMEPDVQSTDCHPLHHHIVLTQE